MKPFTTMDLKDLLETDEPPCVSIYQPTHRRFPENQGGPTQYRQLLEKAEKLMQEKYRSREIRPILEKFQSLAAEGPFWKSRTDGLAVLGSSHKFHVFELQGRIPELVVVADSFHIKPLLRYAQSTDRYHILCLNRHAIRLFEGNQYVLDAVELMNVPTNIGEAVGEVLTEPQLTAASVVLESGEPDKSQRGRGATRGHIAKNEDDDIEAERFFRVVDQAIADHYSRPSGLPLILAALAEHQSLFRKISHNPFLVGDGITINPDRLPLEELRAAAWKIMSPWQNERIAKMRGEFQAACVRQMGTDDLSEIAKAAAEGRVGRLMIDAERRIAGKLDFTSNAIVAGSFQDGSTDDVLDDLCEAVLRRQGEVVVVPSETMPTKNGAAAVYRYQHGGSPKPA